jgi:hypothetical protein
MSKDAINQYDATAANNTDVGGISIDEGMLPSNVNNALREIMSHLKDVDAGTSSLTSPVISGDLTVDTNTMFVNSTNNRVGIGTVSPSSILHLSASNDPIITLTDTGASASADITGSNGNLRLNSQTATIFDMADSEVIRIDSSGNLLVGKTTDSNATSTVGHLLGSDGVAVHTRSGAASLRLGRTSSDGEILSFHKDGTTVGNIGADVGTISIDGGSTAAGILSWNGTRRFRWIDAFYPDIDNSNDLGLSNRRFDDIFATNGTIQTSDQNEKQQIASLTSAEITAAKAISKLFKTFKWNDKVTAKGDAARTHAGVIAQEVQSAMTDASLDAADYAFWCSDTWWETQTQVPAVEAVEAQDAVLDDDGNIVTEAVEAVEAKEAYTRTDTYDTADEAPEGATERTRLGIRYPELLAFVGAATEQRLADIETRLTTLENT